MLISLIVLFSKILTFSQKICHTPTCYWSTCFTSLSLYFPNWINMIQISSSRYMPRTTLDSNAGEIISTNENCEAINYFCNSYKTRYSHCSNQNCFSVTTLWHWTMKQTSTAIVVTGTIKQARKWHRSLTE